MYLSWVWRRRPRRPTAADQARAEALVKVEALGMMGGKAPELRLTPAVRMPRNPRPAITYEPDE